MSVPLAPLASDLPHNLAIDAEKIKEKSKNRASSVRPFHEPQCCEDIGTTDPVGSDAKTDAQCPVASARPIGNAKLATLAPLW